MKLFKTTIVLAIVALISGLLIGGAQAITGPIIERNNNERALAAYREIYPNLDSTNTENLDVDEGSVYKVIIVKNAQNQIEGFIFRAKDNNQFGLVDIIVVVEPDGKIKTVKILETTNTPGFYDKHEDDNGNVKTVKGDSIQSLTGADTLAGQASRTGGSLDKMLKDVKAAAPKYMTVEAEPDVYENIFGEYKNVEEDNLFVSTEIVTKKEIVYGNDDSILGYAYTATGKADIPGKKDAVITLLVGIDNDGKVKGVEKITVEHTPGFVGPHLDVLAGMRDIELDDLKLDDTAKATVSFDLINSLLNAVKEANSSEVSIYTYLFGPHKEVVTDNTFVANEVITKKELIKDENGNTIGVAYTGTGTASIPGNANAVLTVLVGIDTNGKVKGVIELENQHTQNQEGKYYLNYKDTVAGIKDIDVKDLEIDLVVGASRSYEVLKAIFDAIKEAEGL